MRATALNSSFRPSKMVFLAKSNPATAGLLIGCIVVMAKKEGVSHVLLLLEDT
jgi:hypothetical protein